METIKAKFIRMEIDGTMYHGFLQETKGEAAETATPDEATLQIIKSEQRVVTRSQTNPKIQDLEQSQNHPDKL